MLSKCANHECETPFLYLRRGKFFHFPKAEESSHHWHSMESFWLCNHCSEKMTLQWRTGVGVITVHIKASSKNVKESSLEKSCCAAG